MKLSWGIALAVLVLGVVEAGCGSVSAKPDAGTDDAMPVDAPGACTPNTMSCGADDAVYQCDAEGTALTKVQDCQYGCSVDHCKECAPNTTFCSGDDLVECNSDGMIVNPQSCAFGCQADACNACMPNTKYCDGATAVTCGSNGQPSAMMSCGAPGCNGGVCNTCTPNTTTCQGDTLVVCNAGGTVQSATQCALGCGTTPSPHCKQLVPSFGVAAPSGNLPSLVVNDNATLDISNCNSLDVLLTLGGTTTAVPAGQLALVNQNGGPPICVVRYGTITINDPFTLTIVNSATSGHLLSLQGVGDISVSGKIVFSNAANGPSPGGTANIVGTNANNKYIAPGGGGAGAARAGGSGGKCAGCNGGADVPGAGGGAAVTTAASILNGGSAGGNVVMGATVYAAGGRGGGGLQLVSLTRVLFAATAVINLNAGGGTGPSIGMGSQTAGGGGSGGTLVVEAPIVNVSAGAIAAANGGGGSGGCWSSMNIGGINVFRHHNGADGQLSMSRAAGGDCPNTSNGDGGYEANGDAAPSANGAPSDSGAATVDGGGGGGSNGFIVLRGRAAASVMIAFGAIISPAPNIGAVTAN